MSEWDWRNALSFNVTKTQCCLVTNRKIDEQLPPSNSVNAEDLETPDILDRRTQSDVPWTERIVDVSEDVIEGLGF